MRTAILARWSALCLFTSLAIPAAASSGAPAAASSEAASVSVPTSTTADVSVLPFDSAVSLGLLHLADGEYDEADAIWESLAASSPDHPAPYVHAVDTLYWREVHVDDGSHFDSALLAGATQAVEKASAFAERRPGDAVAQLYLGQSLIQLGRYHGMRMRVVKAGGLGERGRKALERALELEPDLADARFPLGLYAYYAGQLPNLLSWLRFLWFVPEGDVEGGLRDLDDARRKGERYGFDAAFYLTNIRAYHDAARDVPWALAQARASHEEHPRNALVHFELLELLSMQGEHEAARLEAVKLEAHPGRERSAETRGRANMATVWRARSELALGHLERAWGTLVGFGEDGPSEPDWGPRWVEVTRGQILDATGRRNEAVRHYRRVEALDLGPDSRALAEARAGLARPPAVGAAPGSAR